MDTASIASSYAATMQAQTGLAIQAEIMKMSASSDANVAALLQAGAESLEAVSANAAPPPGLGATVDISV